MKLSDAKIRTATAQDKAYKLSDGNGLYLLVTKTGSKLWRMDYTFNKKRNTHSLGSYPVVSLQDARNKLLAAKKRLDQGIDLNFHAKTVKLNFEENSFKALAKEWLAKNQSTWSAGYYKKVNRRLEKDIIPWIGSVAIDSLTTPQILFVLQKALDRNLLETAHRIRQDCSAIFRYAISTGRATQDIADPLKGMLPANNAKHYASLTDPISFAELLRGIDDYRGEPTTRHALQLAPLVFLRPGELRHAEWSELEWKNKKWVIPAAKMKMRAPHIVPLSHQVIAILEELKALTGQGPYLFPSMLSASRPMCENTLNTALRRLGYGKDEMTSHGFRSSACTLLNEMGWKSDVIEIQLAHSERNSVRAAYNYAQYLPERRTMMQTWSDYIDYIKKTEAENLLSPDLFFEAYFKNRASQKAG